MLFTPFDSVYSNKGHGNDQGQGPDYFIEKGVCISYVFVSHIVQLIFFLICVFVYVDSILYKFFCVQLTDI